MNAPIDPQVLAQAADWLVRLQDSKVSAQDRHAFEQWRNAAPEHARAWLRAEHLLQRLDELPAALAISTLERAPTLSRRAALGRIALALGVMPAGWLGWRAAQRQGWLADQHTAVGEHRALQLADGSRLTLNTSTRLDIDFSASARRLTLPHGEILLETAPDRIQPARPFLVHTPDAVLRAMGTRFMVRRRHGRTHLAVFDGAVAIALPRQPAQMILVAGQQTLIHAGQIAAPSPADDTLAAWTRGLLLADAMRLDQLVDELGRYTSVYLQCDPAVAALRISGVFPLNDVPRALAMLMAASPVDVAQRFGGYWQTVIPRAEHG
ncbi:FecR domain-containing protein [Amantichitinum ursilacus]|uniref:Fec operon regulator FecR n=1 Tax=Amantichitinum ursilacus TaxID=857265 RepID=A0A0N0XK64_9NEIS|nr:FecR family protein [Amantichitinum ursilacus]KPC54187.1 fec operon regulator FecR [Amantichitinum ursilacus]